MANNFKDTMTGWMDKAEDFLDDLLDKNSETTSKLGESTRRLDNLARASKEDIREEMRSAQAHLKDQTAEITERLDRWIDEIKDRARRSGDVTDEQLERFKAKASRLRDEIKIDSENTSEQIKKRAEHFNDGLDRIREDIEENDAAGGRRVNETSPITGHGDYRAADFDGTLNNYADRVQEHTRATKERMEQEVEDTMEEIRSKARELGIK